MGACVATDNLAMVTEILDGDLEKFLKEHSTPSDSFTFLMKMKMMRDIAKGMAWLHAMEIVHRDLKPSNILLDSNLEAKITDFGLSVVSDTKAKIKKTAGSALWMAPECHRHESYDNKVDVYSYGIVAWQILTGEILPFRHYVEQDAFKEFVDAVSLDDERPSVENVPSIVHELLNKLWHPNPESRPTFQEAIGLIDDVIFQAMIYDEESREFWKASFGDRLEVKYKPFFAALYKKLNMPKPEKGLRECIKLIFCEKTTKVTLTRFGKVISWFGPLVIPGRTDDHLVDRITALVDTTWFWGDIDSKAAERILNPKTFLLRLSNNNQIRKQPFSISIKLKANASTHYRVEYVNGHYHLKNLAVKKGQTINLESRDILGLIEKFTKSKICKGVVGLEGSDFYRFLHGDAQDGGVYGNSGVVTVIEDMFS